MILADQHTRYETTKNNHIVINNRQKNPRTIIANCSLFVFDLRTRATCSTREGHVYPTNRHTCLVVVNIFAVRAL